MAELWGWGVWGSSAPLCHLHCHPPAGGISGHPCPMALTLLSPLGTPEPSLLSQRTTFFLASGTKLSPFGERKIIFLKRRKQSKQSFPSELQPCLQGKEPQHGVCLSSCPLILGWRWGHTYWFLWQWGVQGPRVYSPAEPSETKYFVGGVDLRVGDGWGEQGRL